MAKHVLDKSKEYSFIRGTCVACYQQKNSLYDHYGKYLGEVPGSEVVVVEEPAPEAAKPSQAQKKRDALAAAAAKLGNGGPPQDVQDAQKENAQALAAEDNA
jgi:hypothetical protein